MPMPRVAEVVAARAHDPDFVVRLMVTTFCWLRSTPVAVHVELNVEGVISVTVGAVVLVVNPDGNVTVTELPAPREPVPELV